MKTCLTEAVKHLVHTAPVVVRGLKQRQVVKTCADIKIVPFTGTWIETTNHDNDSSVLSYFRTLRGCID